MPRLVENMNKKVVSKWLIAAALVVAALVAYRVFGWNDRAPSSFLGLDLADPDAVILSPSLSSLPRDLLTIPIARDVLTEDFVYYYEQDADWLGLKGSLRRIAYEHQLNWGDELLRTVLDQPAELALWRDADGTLKHYAIVVARTSFTRLLEETAKVALKDAQLQRAGELEVDGDKVPLYALDHGYQRTLLFAAHGARLLILSHPGMLLDKVGDEGTVDKDAHAVVRKLLAADSKQNGILRERFQLGATAPTGHSVAVKTDFLSFGYQPFFGALQALRFDFSKGAWSSQALVDAGKLAPGGYDSSALWGVLPYHPSACFSVPADWSAMQPVLERMRASDGAALAELAKRFDGPAAACWYGNSRLYTPVFVARRKQASATGQDDALFASLFGTLVGAPAHRAEGTAQRWERAVKTPEGPLKPTLAVSGDTAVFSADPALVDAVLAVQRKQAAAALDHLPAPGRTVGLLDPAALARLIEKEAFDALPADREPVLRSAADEHLLPRLSVLKKYPPYRMVIGPLPSKGSAWTTLEWQAIR